MSDKLKEGEIAIPLELLEAAIRFGNKKALAKLQDIISLHKPIAINPDGRWKHDCVGHQQGRSFAGHILRCPTCGVQKR